MATATYIVQSGDSLSIISKRFFGDFSMVDAIAAANNIVNKNLILPGQKLILPGVEEAEVIETTQGDSSNWWKWLLGVALVGGGAWWYYKKKKPKALSGPNSEIESIKSYVSKDKKSTAAHQVLKLMDHDYSYEEALTTVLGWNKSVKRKKLEKELEQYI